MLHSIAYATCGRSGGPRNPAGVVAGTIAAAAALAAGVNAAPVEPPSSAASPASVARDSAEPPGPLVTDRPDATESTETVPRGRVQFESGYTFTYDREGSTRSRSHAAPEALLRIGLADRLELRLGWEGYAWSHEQLPGTSRAGRSIVVADNTQAASDLYLGAKAKLFDQDGWRPHFGVIPAVTVPSGSPSAHSGDVDPEVKLAWAWDLPADFALAGNVHLGVPTEDGRRFVQSGASLSVAFPLFDGVDGYCEYFGWYPNRRDADAAHSLNGGLTWKITDDLQIDWRVGMGLNEEADDFFTGIGLAIRF